MEVSEYVNREENMPSNKAELLTSRIGVNKNQ